MNRLSLVVSPVLLLVAAGAHAGKIYGSLQVDGKAVPEGTQVQVNCSGRAYPPVKVGSHGRYSINIDQNGPCSLSVAGYAGASIQVISYDQPTRYNLLLKRDGDRFTMNRI